MLADWFESVTLWDVETKQARVDRTPDGQYRVTMDIVAKKTKADSLGKESEAQMDESVEIGVLAVGSAKKPGAAFYLQRHRIRSGVQTLVVTVPREPARAGVDPYRWLIDRKGEDNVIKLSS